MKQFVENEFPQSYYPTIERAYVKTIEYKGTEYVCEIYDTAGQVGGPEKFSVRAVLTSSSRTNTPR